MMTRLIIYLLAMMTGFSAAEAARPVAATPATLGSAVAQAAVVATTVVDIRNDIVSSSLAEIPSLARASAFTKRLISQARFAPSASPISRHDITRQ
jgi:DMSO reductase anchor subunit